MLAWISKAAFEIAVVMLHVRGDSLFVFSSAIFLHVSCVPVLGPCWIYSVMTPGQSLGGALAMIEGDLHIQHAVYEVG